MSEREDDDDDRPRRRRRDDDDDDYRDDDYRRRRDIGDDPMMRMILPVGQSVWAIAAGYLGLFSVLCLPGPLALFCGIMAVREINKNPKKHGMGRAIFGIVMGTFGTLGTILIAVPLTISVLTGK